MRSMSWSFVTIALIVGAVEGARSAETSRPPAVCFAKGTDPEYVARTYARVATGSSLGAPPESFQFTNPRWQTTATSGGGLQQGFPTILTWSVVPDGLSIPSGGVIGEVTAPSNLRARLNAIYGNQSVWQPIIQEAFDEWSSRTGTSYVFVNDDGAPFSNASPGTNSGVGRGDVRIGGHHLDGNFGVLAYNYFPDRGDMVIDTNDSFYTNTSNDSLALRNVIAHEHGHGLGISHVCPIDETKLMEPFFSESFEGPQPDDILAGQRGYGDDGENDDTFATGTNLGTLGVGTFTRTGQSLDDNGDVDFYRFTVASGKRATLTITPIGFTYNQGPQNPTTGACPAGSPFNSLVQNNVSVELLSTNGTTVLASASAQPAGVPETIPVTPLPSAGQFYIRVIPASSDTIQMYNVSLTLLDSNDLVITKTDGATTAVPGQPITYTIVATNTSPSGAATFPATVTDNFPPTITGVSWNCVASGIASCGGGGGTGNINRAVSLPPGGTVTFTATGTIAPTATGTLSNTATVTPDVGSDPTPANNTATDTDTLVPTSDLAITKTDGQTSAVPGTPVTYTIAVGNPGPSSMSGVSVVDTFPAAITGVNWTCVGVAAGASCSAPAGAGNIATTVTLPPGGVVNFTATGAIAPTATGSLANTATIAAAVGSTDPNLTNNSATDTDTLTPTADLAVTKTDGQASAVPGTPITYTIGVSNAGPSASGTATLADPFPSLSGVTWSCTATAGSSCPSSGAGALSAPVSLALAGSATFTATGTIDPTATGSLANTATVSSAGGVTDPGPANNSATDTDTLTPQADFSVTKTDGQLVATPGAPIQYTIVVRQDGPSASGAATVTDTLPGEITGASWTCTASAGSSCPANGAGNIATAVTLDLAGTATFTLSGTVSPSATGTVANTASVAAPGGITDPIAGNNQATDTDNVSLEMSELVHASATSRDLRPIGGEPAEHFYWLAQQPYASYEILIDATSGDIGPTLQLERLAGDGTTVLQSALGTSAIGFSRSLRVVNDGGTALASQLIRVRSGACGTGCGPDDVYRIRMRETTGRIPRFNNSATQVTIVILQNTSEATIAGTMRFWRANGALAASQAFTVGPHALSIVNSSGIPGLAGTSGSVTIVHDGPYGALVGKSVALEPATGFSFDSSLVPLVR